MKTSTFAFLLIVVGGAATGHAGDPVLLTEELRDDGTRHVCVRGEKGLRWTIERYETTLAALRDEDGTIPEKNLDKARFFSARLEAASALLAQYDSSAAPKATGGQCAVRETASFGDGNYVYTTCADALYDPPYHHCPISKNSGPDLDPPAQVKAVGEHSSAWAYLDMSDLRPNSYMGFGVVHAYLNGSEDSEWAMASTQNPVLSISAGQSDWSRECAYASSEIYIFTTRISIAMIDYQYCEDTFPAGCL